MTRLRLGVNIDHVATIRNARGGPHPDPVRAAKMAMAAGADGITAHLREDRRHINDDDLASLLREGLPLNLEMAATEEMLAIALLARPHACCIVPERREERTTEGGLDAAGTHNRLAPFVATLKKAGIEVTLFIEADARQFQAARALNVPVVELHTGAYHDAGLAGDRAGVARQLDALRKGAREAASLGLEVHAGHGLTYANVGAIAAIPEIVELQIGHFLIGEAVFAGLDTSIKHMRAMMDEARGNVMIIGLGSDLIDIRRVEKTLERYGPRFVDRIFTDVEQRKSERRAARAASYAKRFAAKEACAKALGTGLRAGVFWRDMGVVNLPSGQPTMRLTRGAAKRLAEITPKGMTAQINLTITDDYPLAQAIVIITAVAEPSQSKENS